MKSNMLFVEFIGFSRKYTKNPNFKINEGYNQFFWKRITVSAWMGDSELILKMWSISDKYSKQIHETGLVISINDVVMDSFRSLEEILQFFQQPFDEYLVMKKLSLVGND